MISFKNFSFKYNNVVDKTLKNIDLTINKGEKVLIVGPSGSGKSTLSHCINGLIPFSYRGEFEGELKIDDIIPYKESLSEVSKKVGTILQDQDSQFIGLSVGEDVAFSFENNAIPLAEMKVKVINSLELVNMVDFINHSPYELSGGQKQRVSLAGVLGSDAEILLFDEPLANLDPASGSEIMQLINDIHEKTNKTIIIVDKIFRKCRNLFFFFRFSLIILSPTKFVSSQNYIFSSFMPFDTDNTSPISAIRKITDVPP